MPDSAHIVLVRQYRYAVDRWIWELPAGNVEPGEDIETAARRECHEEIGRIPDRVERLAELYPTPGYSDEVMVFFRLVGLSIPIEPAHLDEDEILEPQLFTLADVRARIERGEIQDMKTALGIRMLLSPDS
jgi:ADP-ribose pyrophosphatase